MEAPTLLDNGHLEPTRHDRKASGRRPYRNGGPHFLKTYSPPTFPMAAEGFLSFLEGPPPVDPGTPVRRSGTDGGPGTEASPGGSIGFMEEYAWNLV